MNINYLEGSVVYRKASMLFNQVQQALGSKQPWDPTEMARALGRLDVYADVLTDLVAEFNSKILSGDAGAEAPMYLTAANLLSQHIAVIRNTIRVGGEAVNAAVDKTLQQSVGEAPVPTPLTPGPRAAAVS